MITDAFRVSLFAWGKLLILCELLNCEWWNVFAGVFEGLAEGINREALKGLGGHRPIV